MTRSCIEPTVDDAFRLPTDGHRVSGFVASTVAPLKQRLALPESYTDCSTHGLLKYDTGKVGSFR